MTVYTAPSTRPYQRPFRIISWSAIVALLGIFLFSIYEPEGVSRSANVGLAYLMGAIVLGAVGYGLFLSRKEAMWKVEHAFQWELTDGKIVQRHNDGKTVEIALNEVKSLHESHGWLLVRGGEPLRGIAIPSDLNGFEYIKQELNARCGLTPLKVKVSPFAFLPHTLGILSLLCLFISHIPTVVLVSGATLLLVLAYATMSLRRIWRTKPIPKLVLLSYVLTWLITAWLVFQRVKAVS